MSLGRLASSRGTRLTTGTTGRGGRVTSLMLLTAAAWIVFSIVGQGFLSPFSIYSLTQSVGVVVLIGLAQAAMLVLGRINLAVGGIGVVVSAAVGLMLNFTPLPLPLVLLLAITIGIAAGLIMGLVEIKSKLNSFVVTLAFLALYSGSVLLLTQATYFPITPAPLLWLGNGNFISAYVSPICAVAVLIAVVLWVFYFFTTAGWRARAVGANQRAASASGVRTTTTVLTGYALSGGLSAVAAICVASQLAVASPTIGSDWMLLSFIGPLLGGVALAGGIISIGGTVVGSLFYVSIFSGFSVLSVPTYWLTLAQALILLLALLVGQLDHRFGARLTRRTRSEENDNA